MAHMFGFLHGVQSLIKKTTAIMVPMGFIYVFFGQKLMVNWMFVRCVCQEALSKVVEPGLRLHHTVWNLSGLASRWLKMAEMAEMAKAPAFIPGQMWPGWKNVVVKQTCEA